MINIKDCSVSDLIVWDNGEEQTLGVILYVNNAPQEAITIKWLNHDLFPIKYCFDDDRHLIDSFMKKV